MLYWPHHGALAGALIMAVGTVDARGTPTNVRRKCPFRFMYRLNALSAIYNVICQVLSRGNRTVIVHQLVNTPQEKCH